MELLRAASWSRYAAPARGITAQAVASPEGMNTCCNNM